MIRVIIERQIAKGQEHDYHQTIRRLKQKASHFPGYLSGEVLIDSSNPCHCITLSSWERVEDWQQWADSEPDRYCPEG